MAIDISGIGAPQLPVKDSGAIAKARDVVAALLGSQTSKEIKDVASLTIALKLQTETSGLRDLSASLAKTISVAQTADEGVSQIQDILGQLKDLATKAQKPGANNAALDAQFQKIVKSIDQVVKNTTFDDKQLLNGDLANGVGASLDKTLAKSIGEDLKLPDLSSRKLLGDGLNVLNVDAAARALTAVATALTNTASARASIAGFENAIGFTAANIDSALNNQEAAQSLIEGEDFSLSSLSALANLQSNQLIALAAQGNNLSPTLLQLIG